MDCCTACTVALPIGAGGEAGMLYFAPNCLFVNLFQRKLFNFVFSKGKGAHFEK